LINTNRPYLLPKNSFGVNIPNKNIHLSGHHRIIFMQDENNYLGVQAFKLEKCQKETQLPTEIIYYHVKLQNRGEGLIVNNLPVEDCVE